MGQIMNQNNRNLKEYTSGAFVAFTGLGIGTTFVIWAFVLALQVDPTFSILTDYLSTLGGLKVWPAVVFNTGMILISPIRVLFAIYLAKYLRSIDARDRWVNLALIAVVIGAAGTVILSGVPFTISYEIHMLGAKIYFLASIIFQIVVSSIEFRSPETPNFLGVSGIAVVVTYLVFFVLEMGDPTLLGLSETAPCFWEWSGFISVMLWLGLHGTFLQHLKPPEIP